MLVDEQPGPLLWLQGWYASQCDGEWEHSDGIVIETLDNPGWLVRIDVARTALRDRGFERVETKRGEHDWVQAWLSDGRFQVACGPLNLGEGLHLFRLWVQARQ